MFRIQKVNNLSVIFSFLKDDLGIRLENMGPEDVCGGNVKMILGLVWTLISHFQFEGLNIKAQMSARGAVLEWARGLVAPSGLEVANLSSDWEDGRILCAIVHGLRPDLLDLNDVKHSSPIDKINHCLSILEQNCKVPHILDAQDILSQPDEKSLITFLAEVMKVKREGVPKTSTVAAAAPRSIPAPVVVTTATTTTTAAGPSSNVLSPGRVPPSSAVSPGRPSPGGALPNAPANTIPALLFAAAKQFGTSRCYADDMGAAPAVSWTEHAANVCAALQGMLAIGVKRGDRVVIMGDAGSGTRTVYLAAQCAAAVPVCLYARDLTLVELSYAVQCSGARVIFVTSPGLWEKLAPRAAELDNVKLVVFGAGISAGPAGATKLQSMSWSEFGLNGKAVLDKTLDVRPQDAASWVFTSGMTGPPKPVVLTHQMLVEAGRAAQNHLSLSNSDLIASHLSLANALQQVLDIIVPCVSGAQVAYCSPNTDFRIICSTTSPTVVAGLPQQWHSLIQIFSAEHNNKEMTDLSASEKAALVRSVRLDKCRWPLCVWAPISVATVLGFRTVGIPLYRVYGLAEACGLVSMEGPNRASSSNSLVVGTPVSSVQVAIGDKGEVLVSGASVFSEYATAKANRVDGGYFPTGDFGSFDGTLLQMQGRLSDVFELQSGALVYPAEVECSLREHPFVAHAIVVGRGQNFAVAFLTLDRAVMEPVAKSRGISVAQLASSPQVGSAIKAHVDRINATRSRDVRIRKFAILPAVHASKGELTPTQCVRGEEVMRRNGKASDALFSPDTSGDVDRLRKCAAAAGAPVTLFTGPSMSSEFGSLWDLAEGVTYWTEDGNDVSRNGSRIVLSGQEVVTLQSAAGLVDEDELALVNMLYANGPAVSIWENRNASGTELRAAHAEDFVIGATYYTRSGTSVLRRDECMLVIDGQRQVPLEIVVSDFCSEVGDTEFSSEPEPPTPSTPGSRRLADIRKNKEKEEAEKRRKAEEKKRARDAQEEAERAAIAALEDQRKRAQEERERQEQVRLQREREREEQERNEEERRLREEKEAEERRQERERQEREDLERQSRMAEQEQLRAKRRQEEERGEEEKRESEAAAEDHKRKLLALEEEQRSVDELRRQMEAEVAAQEERDRTAAAAAAAVAAAASIAEVEARQHVFVVVGCENAVGRAALAAINQKELAGDKFNIRAVFCGSEDTTFEQQNVMRELSTVSEAVAANAGDRQAMEDAFQDATRALIIVGDEYRYTPAGRASFANGVSIFEAAKARNLESVVFLSRASGTSASAEFQAIENNMEAILGDGSCVMVRSSLTFEEVVGDLHISEDGKGLFVPFGRGKIAPLSIADLGAFCGEMLVRDGLGGSCVTVTGPTLIGGWQIAEAMDLTVIEDAGESVDVSQNKRDEERAISRGEMAFVSTETFENMLKREPVPFDKWADENLLSDEVKQKRADAERKKKEEEQAALQAAAAQRLSVTTTKNRKSTSSGWERTDVSIIRAKNATRLGSKCRLCSHDFGIARWSAACCECDEVACRKCLHMFSSSLVKPSHPAVFGVPAQVCDKCLPDVAKRIEQAGGGSDMSLTEVRTLGCIPSGEEVPYAESEAAASCSVCQRKFGRFRAAEECTCCSQRVCGTCYRMVTSDVLDFPAPSNNVLCETCVPDLKNEIRSGGLEAKLCERELYSLDLVTLGLRGPVDLVTFQADLSAAEQDAVIQSGKEKCHVCSSDFGFLLRPHRCGSCSRLVCSKDAANHVSSDLLVINDSWVCFSCFPFLTEELKAKKRDNVVLDDLIQPELAALTEAYATRRTSKPNLVEGAQEKAASPLVKAQRTVSIVPAGKEEEGTDSGHSVEDVAMPVKSCSRCSSELNPIVRQAGCSVCQESACSKCSYHFRSTAMGWPPQSQWVCSRCVATVVMKIAAVGKERPKTIGAVAIMEAFPPKIVSAGGVFAPWEEPEFFDFTAKEVKLIESGKSKCYTCASKHNVLCKPVRCGKCKKIACMRCTESFQAVGFTMKRNFGDVAICRDCWPGVRIELDDLATRDPSVAKELRVSMAMGDAALTKSAPLKQHPLEAKFNAKALVKQKCRECNRKASPLRGLSQCDHCEQIVCTTCSGQFCVPEIKQQGWVRACMTCVDKLQDRIKRLSQSSVVSAVQLPPDSQELVRAHPNCKHCEKSFDFWRRPYMCFNCDVPSCWQCATKAYKSITDGSGKVHRLCKGCIPELGKQIEEDASFPDADKQRELTVLRAELAKIEGYDRSQDVVEHISEDDDAVKSPSAARKDSGSKGSGEKSEKPALEKRPSFLHRTFSRKIKETPSATGCAVCAKQFGRTRKQKQCSECTLGVCGSCSADMVLTSLKWPAKRTLCDKCVGGLRARVVELQVREDLSVWGAFLKSFFAGQSLRPPDCDCRSQNSGSAPASGSAEEAGQRRRSGCCCLGDLSAHRDVSSRCHRRSAGKVAAHVGGQGGRGRTMHCVL